MNSSILQKCVDELGKDTPKLDYIRGMLETLIELSGAKKDEYIIADGQGKVRITTPEKEIEKVRMQTDSVPDVPSIPLNAIEEARQIARQSGAEL